MFYSIHVTQHIATPCFYEGQLVHLIDVANHCSAYDVIYLLQRRMPWLEDR